MISPRRTAWVTGALFIASTVTFMIAATVLSMTFDWPDILRQPADVVLPEFAAGGALLGEHLGQLLAIAWSVTVSVLILRSHVMPAWTGWLGLLASALYFVNQGDIMSTAISGFPVWDLGGLLGSYLWAIWLLAIGVLLLRRANGGPR